MAAKPQLGAREAIQHLSSIITDCAIPKVPSESFRQAKFNKDDATVVLWTLLLNVVQLLLFLDSKSKGEEVVDCVRYCTVSSDRNTLRTAALVVKKYLLSLGYSRAEFYSTPLGSGSRELLMAFGWLVHESKLIKKLCTYHSEIASAVQIPFKTSKAFAIRGIVEESNSIETEIAQIASNLSQVVMKQKERTTEHQPHDTLCKVDEALQKLAWLRGKLQAKWKFALNSQLAYLKLANRLHRSTLIQNCTSEKAKRPHLSVHELFLLRYPDHLLAYLKKVERHVASLQRLVQWQRYEPVFWQWMESVLDLHERERDLLIREQMQQAEDAQSTKVNGSVECQLESLERLTEKVRVLERAVLDTVAKHKPYLEKIQRVWQLKAKAAHSEEMERELIRTEKEMDSLLLKTDQCIQLKLLRVKDATSKVETLTPQDRAVCVAESGTERTKLLSRRAAHPMPLQHQKSTSAELVHDSRCYHEQISSELERTQSLIQQHREDIRRQLHAIEQQFPMSVCKIQK